MQTIVQGTFEELPIIKNVAFLSKRQEDSIFVSYTLTDRAVSVE